MWSETIFSIDYEQVLFCIIPGMCIYIQVIISTTCFIDNSLGLLARESPCTTIFRSYSQLLRTNSSNTQVNEQLFRIYIFTNVLNTVWLHLSCVGNTTKQMTDENGHRIIHSLKKLFRLQVIRLCFCHVTDMSQLSVGHGLMTCVGRWKMTHRLWNTVFTEFQQRFWNPRNAN
jgi:hypothetical protein